MEGTMAVVTCFGANFAPKNWASCNGQIMSIAQNQALFSLLGTTYGGNGVSTFGLPDMRGRTQVGVGTGAGLPSYTLGENIGTESVTLSVSNLPPHNHNGPISLKLQADNTGAADTTPDFEYPSIFTNGYASTPTPGTTMVTPTYAGTIGVAGASQPFEILDPYTVVNYIICTYGIFPSRN
jgi:microcystin-dependent protein